MALEGQLVVDVAAELRADLADAAIASLLPRVSADFAERFGRIARQLAADDTPVRLTRKLRIATVPLPLAPGPGIVPPQARPLQTGQARQGPI